MVMDKNNWKEIWKKRTEDLSVLQTKENREGVLIEQKNIMDLM